MELSEDDTLDRHILYTGSRHAYSEKGICASRSAPVFAIQGSRHQFRRRFLGRGTDHDFGAVQLGVSTGITFDDDPDTGETYERKYGTVTLSKAWPRTTAACSRPSRTTRRALTRSDDTESGQRVAIGTSLSYELTPRLTASTAWFTISRSTLTMTPSAGTRTSG
jgi:hypothetical protein